MPGVYGDLGELGKAHLPEGLKNTVSKDVFFCFQSRDFYFFGGRIPTSLSHVLDLDDSDLSCKGVQFSFFSFLIWVCWHQHCTLQQLHWSRQQEHIHWNLWTPKAISFHDSMHWWSFDIAEKELVMASLMAVFYQTVSSSPAWHPFPVVLWIFRALQWWHLCLHHLNLILLSWHKCAISASSGVLGRMWTALPFDDEASWLVYPAAMLTVQSQITAHFNWLLPQNWFKCTPVGSLLLSPRQQHPTIIMLSKMIMYIV